MKVGFVVYGSLDACTGGYLYDRMLVDHLTAQGDTVDTVSLPWRTYTRHLADNFSSALMDQLADASFDVLLQDELNHPSLLDVNRRLRKNAAYPIVSVVHLLRSSERARSRLRPLYAAIERRYFNTVDAAVFNGATTRAAVDELVGRPVPGVIALPGNDHLALPHGPRVNGHGPLRVLSVANVLPGKGLHVLVDALGRLPLDAWTLTVVGSVTSDPDYASRLRHHVDHAGLAQNVEFTGEVPNELVAKYMADHHVLAMLSSYEALGIAYLEAMRSGLPVIATTAGGAREVVSDGDEGFLVDPGDIGAVTSSLAKFVDDRGLVTRMGEAAARRATSHPTWQQSFAPVRGFLESLVNAS